MAWNAKEMNGQNSTRGGWGGNSAEVRGHKHSWRGGSEGAQGGARQTE